MADCKKRKKKVFLTSFCITLQGSLPVAFALSVPNVPTPRGVVPTHHVTPQGIYIGSLPSHLGHHDLSCDKVWQVSLVVCDCRFNCKFVLLPFSKFASSLLKCYCYYNGTLRLPFTLANSLQYLGKQEVWLVRSVISLS